MHPEVDRYAHLASPLHRWDPALKWVSLLILGAGLASIGGLPAAGLGLALSAGLVAISGIPLLFVLRRLRWIILFMIPFLALLPLGLEDPASGRFGPKWSAARFELAVVLTARALAIALAAVALLGSTPFHRSMKALRELAVPDALVQMILFTYRFLFVYLDQLRKMRIAMMARGFRPRARRLTLRAYGNLVGMLLVGSYEQTERILQAMRSRGFSGRMRTLEPTSRHATDWLKLALIAGLAGALLVADRLWPA